MIIEGYPRYIGVTDEEEAILLRALEVHRNLLRHLADKKYGKHEHRELKAKRLETIEALMERVFPTGETEAEVYARLEAEAAADPLPPDPERDRIMRRLVEDAQKDAQKVRHLTENIKKAVQRGTP